MQNQQPKILKKFSRLNNRGKVLYTEAFKIMSATTQVIQMQMGSAKGGDAEFSATAYFACLHDMVERWVQDLPKEAKQVSKRENVLSIDEMIPMK